MKFNTDLSYSAIHERLKCRSSRELLSLLDEKNVKIGDTASCILSMRDARKVMLSAALSGEFRTKNGKVRALAFFSRRGRSMPEAIPVYIKYIGDNHRDVVGGALFPLVLWNSRKFLPAIRDIKNPRMLDLRDEAIAAIERRRPKIYTKNYLDALGVWKRKGS